jgi:hypothetical protein
MECPPEKIDYANGQGFLKCETEEVAARVQRIGWTAYAFDVDGA